MSDVFTSWSEPFVVIPAQAGIHMLSREEGVATIAFMDSRLRGDDEVML